MAVFECPYCRSVLSAGNLRPGTAMKCPKCAGEFVFQNPATAGGGSLGGASGTFAPASSANWLRDTFTNRGIQMLIALVLAIAGAIVMVVIAVNHSSQPQPSAAPAPVAAVAPSQPGSAKPEAAKSQGPAAIPTDPGLEVTANVGVDAGGNAYAYGTVLNTFDVPLNSIHLKVYIQRAAGPTGECLFVPPKTALPFSIPLGAASDVLTKANIVVSAFAEAAPAGTVMWSIPDTTILRGVGGDSRIWTGETANPTKQSVHDIRIYCDFYSKDGLQGSFASANLDAESLMPGQRARFALRCEDIRAESAEIVVARAVAQTR